MSQRSHRRSIRLPGYDYTQPGAYFITICCHERREIFGEIVAGEMQLNTCGRIAYQEWERLPSRFRSLRLGAFVIMPNHVHGILIITDDHAGRGTAASEEDSNPSSTRRAPTREGFGQPVPGSIPTILRSYKSAVTLRVNRLRDGPNHPVWQRNYYEHVIRNDGEHERIHEYILGNPRHWDEDRENPIRRLK